MAKNQAIVAGHATPRRRHPQAFSSGSSGDASLRLLAAAAKTPKAAACIGGLDTTPARGLFVAKDPNEGRLTRVDPDPAPDPEDTDGSEAEYFSAQEELASEPEPETPAAAARDKARLGKQRVASWHSSATYARPTPPPEPGMFSEGGDVPWAVTDNDEEEGPRFPGIGDEEASRGSTEIHQDDDEGAFVAPIRDPGPSTQWPEGFWEPVVVPHATGDLPAPTPPTTTNRVPRRKLWLRKVRHALLPMPVLRLFLGKELAERTKPQLRRLARGETPVSTVAPEV